MAKDLRNVAPDLWPDLIAEYRFFCQRALPTDCRSLLRMVSEGEHVGWAGYADRAAYLREGLGLDPQAAEWAIAGLGMAGVVFPIDYGMAQKLGWGGARAKAGRKFKNDTATHYNQDDLNVTFS